MDADYSRNTASVLENVIWPDISTLSEYLNSRFTFLFTPQFHYQDEHEPVSQELEYFFRLLHEKQFEAGLSSTRDTDTFCLPHFFTALPLSFSLCKGK